MDVIGVIPARYSSTRFTAKVLAPIAGKPMLCHAIEVLARANEIATVFVVLAQDDALFASSGAGSIGAKVGNQPLSVLGKLKQVTPSSDDPLKRGGDGLFQGRDEEGQGRHAGGQQGHVFD